MRCKPARPCEHPARLHCPRHPAQVGQQYDEEGLRRTVEEQAKTAHVMGWLQQNIKVRGAVRLLLGAACC